MSANQELSFDAFDEQLLDLYNEQFKFSSFKTMIQKKSDHSNELINKLISTIKKIMMTLILKSFCQMSLKKVTKKGL